MGRLAFVLISFAAYSQKVDWITQDQRKPFLDVRTYIASGENDLTIAINKCISHLPNGGTCSLGGLSGSNWVISSTINVPAGISLKIGTMKIAATNGLNTCMINLLGNGAEVYGTGVHSWLYVGNDNYNIRTICGQADNLKVHDLRITGPPHWYDESKLHLGNAVYLGCSPSMGECANGTRFKRMRIYNNHIESGQNGVVLANVDGGLVYNNTFEVADRTGSMRAPGCIGVFCPEKGLADVMLAGCHNSLVQWNRFSDAKGWRMANAGYDRPAQDAGTNHIYGRNAWIANRIEKPVNSEVLNSIAPYTLFAANIIRSSYALVGIGFYAVNRYQPNYSSARMNHIEITGGAAAYYCTTVTNLNLSGDVAGMVIDGNTCRTFSRGFLVSSAKGGTVTGAIIQNNKATVTDAEGSILIAGAGVRDSLVRNNSVSGGGIQIATGPSETRVVKNNIRNAASHCIVFQENLAPTSGGVIEGNMAYGCAGYGIAFSPNISGVVVRENRIFSASKGRYQMSSKQLRDVSDPRTWQTPLKTLFNQMRRPRSIQ